MNFNKMLTLRDVPHFEHRTEIYIFLWIIKLCIVSCSLHKNRLNPLEPLARNQLLIVGVRAETLKMRILYTF